MPERRCGEKGAQGNDGSEQSLVLGNKFKTVWLSVETAWCSPASRYYYYVNHWFTIVR